MRIALLTQGENSLKVKSRFTQGEIKNDTSRRIIKIKIKGDNQEQKEKASKHLPAQR